MPVFTDFRAIYRLKADCQPDLPVSDRGTVSLLQGTITLMYSLSEGVSRVHDAFTQIQLKLHSTIVELDQTAGFVLHTGVDTLVGRPSTVREKAAFLREITAEIVKYLRREDQRVAGNTGDRVISAILPEKEYRGDGVRHLSLIHI